MQTRSQRNANDAAGANGMDTSRPATPTSPPATPEDNTPATPGRNDEPTPQHHHRRVPDDSAPVTSTPMTSEATFSQASVSALLTALQRSQTEAFRDIIESVMRTPPVVSDSQTLARCRANFSGSTSESVTAFIDSVDSYIDCCKVSDANVLKGLSMLLQGEAAIWWQGLREQITDWAEAKKNLISAFGDRRPPHKIYLDIFNNPQRTENTDLFMSKIRSLFAKLPKHDISENAKLDITYGLLHTRIKVKLRREEFSSFSQLLHLARDIEDSCEEERKSARNDHATRAPPPASKSSSTSVAQAAQAARNRMLPSAPLPPRAAPELQRAFTATSTPVATSPAANTDSTGAKKHRPQCSYCKRFNHTRDQCRKLASRGESSQNNFSADVCDSGDKGKESFYSIELPSSRNKNECVNSGDKCVRSNRGDLSNNNLNVVNSSNNSKITANNVNHHLCSCLSVANDASNYLENSSDPRSSDLCLPRTSASALEQKSQTTKYPSVNACNIQSNINVCYRNWVPHNNACACTRSEKNTDSDFVCVAEPKHLCCHKIKDVSRYSARANCSEKLPVCVNSSGANCTGRLPVCVNSSRANCMEKFPHSMCSCETISCHGDVTKNECNCEIQKSRNLFTGKNDVNNLAMSGISDDCICSGEFSTSGNSRERPLTCREIRPIFKIEILGVSGTALVDTGAKHCIAGHTLYALLLRKGQPLVSSTRQIKLADGHVRNMDVLTATLAVSLDHKVITIPFLIFPDSDNNETLLGIDFITAAGVVIDFHREIWYFSKNNTIKHKLLFEPTSRQISCSSANVLRDDEGAHLNPAERNALAEVLVRHENIFEAGGGPTPFAEHCIETGNHPPIAVPPYRLNPAKKELMKQEINKLLHEDIKFEYTPGKANVVADTLSRPICSSETVNDCGICSIVCDLPTKSPNQLRQEQLSDPELTKIIKDLEGTDEVASQRWYDRGYLMNQGVLYRYNPDSESESPQLVIPADQVVHILKELHDSPLAGHPGIDRTYQKVAQQFYFTGMRRVINNYVGACIHCQRYKASNAKPTGLLQTPVMSQRNEVLAIDLFGPLPEGDQGERWVFLIEDTATRWVELFALQDATAEACARVLIEEYFLRFGLPRRIISDNGVQFVSAVMRQCMSVLDVKQNFVPLYHPQANPAERKNRDLKAMLAHLVEEDHTSWPKKLPLVRFALNGSRCRTTGMSPAYLTFAREMRSPTEVTHDIRAILSKDNFEPQITPYLKKFLNSLSAIRERVEIEQDKTKEYADQSRRPAVTFQVGDLVLLKSHVLSSARKNLTAKFAPKRDGPYQISDKVSPTTYILSNVNSPNEILGKYHIQDLASYKGKDTSLPNPIIPKRKRGRPATDAKVLVQQRGRSPGLEGEHIVNHLEMLPHRASRGRIPARFRE